MGIELPTPAPRGGEAPAAPQNSSERVFVPTSSERLPGVQNAEVSTSERPAPQELRTGQGAGDGFSQAPQSDVSTTTIQDTAVSSTPFDTVPVVAADEDLIEKQWVDSTKKIIRDTRSDPYSQSEAISQLQADYLQKRYGKTLADSGA